MVTSTVDPQASGIGRDSTGESVCCRAAAILVKSPYLTLRTLRCNYEEGKLTLQGEVQTFYLKQLAQSVISDIACPNKVMNLIHVVPPGTRGRAR